MEDLKELANIIGNLPELAVWLMVGFYIYKVIIVGSIFGVIKFTVSKLHDYLVHKRNTPTEIIRQEIHLEDLLHSITISSDNTMELLIHQLKRLASVNNAYRSQYIHKCTVEWLAEAITEKQEKDLREG